MNDVEKEVIDFAQPLYNRLATKRKNLKLVQVNGTSWAYCGDEAEEPVIVFPVIYKEFVVYGSDGKLNQVAIRSAVIHITDLENLLLSPCVVGDTLFEALPFQCNVWLMGGEWKGVFRECLNTERTPTMADAVRVTQRPKESEDEVELTPREYKLQEMRALKGGFMPR